MKTAHIRWYKVMSLKGSAPVAVAAANAYEAGDIAHQTAGIKNPVMVWLISSATGTENKTILQRYWAHERDDI